MKLLFFIISSCLLISIGFSQNSDPIIDSLEKLIKSSNNKHRIITTKAELVKSYFNLGNKAKSKKIYENALLDAKKLNFQAGIGELYNSYGCNFYSLSAFDSALFYFEKSLLIRSKIKDSIGELKALSNIGSIYYAIGENKKGLEYLEKALKKETDFGIKEGTYVSINNIGYIYLGLQLYQKAFVFFRKAEKANISNNNLQSLAFSYDGMATVYQSLNKKDSALLYSFKSLATSQKINDVYSIAYTYNSIGGIYIIYKEYEKAKDYIAKSLLVNEKINDQRLLLTIYGNMSQVMAGQNRPKEAYNYIEKVIALERKFNIKADKMTISNVLSDYFYQKKDYNNAYIYLKEFIHYKDSLYSTDVTNQITELETKYSTEKKEKENKVLQLDNEIKNKEIDKHKTTRKYLIGVIFLFLCIVVGSFVAYKKIKRFNKLLGQQKNAIEQKNHLLEEQKKEITDSINYAKRIQYALLANEGLLKRNLDNAFIFFKPKDIVSGDFYWATEHDNKFYLAVCDSTGHGVPGAFMSLLNIGFLNEAVKEKNILEPNEILNHVRNRLINSIGNEGQQDGMDAVLICFDKILNTASYAAANNGPLIIRENKTIELPKNKMPVGKGEKMESFTLYKMDLRKGDMLYLYTDGFADQFGGPKGKKFKYKQLNELLILNVDLPVLDQKEKLNASLNVWKGNLEQVDDICIVGLKI